MSSKKQQKNNSVINRCAHPDTHIIQPRSAPTSTDELHPIFDFSSIRKGFCVTECEHQQQSQFISAIIQYSKMCWRAMKASGRHQKGLEKIALNAIKGDNTRFLPLDTTLLALRVIGTIPMVGYRIGQVFKILWVDRNYKLYDHG